MGQNILGVLPALWALLILVLGPAAGIAGGRKLRAQTPKRKAIYISNAANLVLLAVVTAAIDLTRGREAFGVLTNAVPYRTTLGWSVAFLLACVATSFAVLVSRARLHRPPKQLVLDILPRSNGEKIAFVFICLLAGTVEEFIYRGFVMMHLREWLDSDLIAVLVVSISFALMHGIQDLIAIFAAFIQSVLLSIPVLVMHSLVPSMVAHTAVDLFAGFCMLFLLRRFGARIELDDS
jgi:membrane protease YdiL (CAAX protease family)